MKVSILIRPPHVVPRHRLSPIGAALVACAAVVACSDESDDRRGPGGGAAGAHSNRTAGAGGRGGSAGMGAGSAGMPKAGAGGDTDEGGAAGDMHAGGGGGGDSGAAGQGGEAGSCSAGYARQGDSCVDVDECAATFECPESATCVNTDGGYDCACAPGYSLDVDGGCVAACAPRDLDGAQIALSLGHADVIATAFDAASGELALFVSDDSFPIREEVTLHRRPESVLVHGNPNAIIQVPDIPALHGILEPNTDVWLLPEGQPEAAAAGLIWPGFQSYGIEQGALEGNKATLRLVSIEGEGKFVGFATVQDEATPPDLLFDPEHGLNEFTLSAGTHLHLNWAFTQGGLHRLTFELEATTTGGRLVKSSPHTYRFFFGDLTDLPTTEPAIVVAEGLESSYAGGAQLVLTAARYGAPSTLPSAWSRQCYDPVTFDPLPWEPLESGDTLTTTVNSGCQYLTCLMDGSKAVATSQAVTPLVD